MENVCLDRDTQVLTSHKQQLRERLGSLSGRKVKVLGYGGLGVVGALALLGAGFYYGGGVGLNNAGKVAVFSLGIMMAVVAGVVTVVQDVKVQEQETMNRVTNDSLRFHAVRIKGDSEYFSRQVALLQHDYEKLSSRLVKTNHQAERLLCRMPKADMGLQQQAEFLHLSEELLGAAGEVARALEAHDGWAARAALTHRVEPLEKELSSYVLSPSNQGVYRSLEQAMAEPSGNA